tara:strand:+ start:449 stop:3208 length:2760 start_codon:yes stop_codon:yes gene_type:complete
MTEFQAVSWEAYDTLKHYVVHIFGRTADGKSVCVTTPFKPYFFIKAGKLSSKRIIDRLKERFPEEHETEQYSRIVHSTGLVRAKDLMGFQNSNEIPFVMLNFNTSGNMKKMEWACHKMFPGMVYEANIEPFLRLMHRTGIKSTGWLRAEGEVAHHSHCDVDIEVKDWNTLTPLDRDDIAPLKIMSFDIETNSSTGKFPTPLEPGDAIFQIAMTTRLYGSDDIIDKVCLCYKQTSGPDIICYPTEKALLEGFRDHLVDMDPDVMTGYNIFGFDLEFIWFRSVYNRCSMNFYNLGRLRDRACEYKMKKLSSGALGDNTLKMIPMNGRYIFDLFHEIKREKKLDSYSLNNVSKLYLNDQKIDMPAREMFARYLREDPGELGEVAEYCIKDTLLPHQLLDKLCIFTNLIEMAKATWVPLSYLSERAQQIKVFSQITRKARELNFMVPTVKKRGDEDGYEGATVLEAHVGAYYTPITALDFASLYPSIMMAHNLCFSTMVMNTAYADVPGVVYEKFEVSGKTYTFAQNVPSLLPVILTELKEFRKKAKKLMAQHRGTPMEEIYNGQQLAYKISMNSIYGFCGASRGMLPCVPIAATTTAQGRNMISMTKECVESNFEGAVVRYGDTDSVMIEFDCKGMSTEDAITHSWKLGEEAATMCNKLFKKPNDLELEKVYCPYILYSKKRYAAKMWTRNREGAMEMEKIDVKGLQLVRRDNTPYTREVSKEVLESILESSNPREAIELAKTRAQQLLDGEVDISKLIMSKSLSDEYKTKPTCSKCLKLECNCGAPMMTKWKYKNMMNEVLQPIPSQPHVQVVEKMNRRNPGSHPHAGDRVPFVLVKHADPGAKMYQKAEDPQVATQEDLDYMYYFTNQLKKPVEDLLEPLIKGDDIFGSMLPPKKIRKKKVEVKCQDIREMFKGYMTNNK